MQELVKKFDPNLSAHRSLSQAHKAMLRIARHVNEVKKQRENALRAQDLQSCLSGWDDVSLFYSVYVCMLTVYLENIPGLNPQFSFCRI